MSRQFINSSEKLSFHVQRITRLIHDQILVPPVNIEIDLSNRCSLGCKWCHFAGTHSRGPLVKLHNGPKLSTGDLMSLSAITGLGPQIKVMGVKSVTWTGGGDPTTHPEADAIFQGYAGLQIDQGIYTNGHTLTKNQAIVIAKNFSWIYFSLDAASADRYAQGKQVQERIFDLVIWKIRRQVKLRGRATIGLGFLLDEDTYTEAEKMVELGRSLGVDYVQFRPVIKFDEELPSRVVFDRSWTDAAIEHLYRFNSDPFVLADLTRFWNYGHWNGHRYPTCWWAGLQTTITPDGQVWTCVNKRGFLGESIGNINDDSFQVIWARRKIPKVNDRCRVMCRGDIPNTDLYDFEKEPPIHRNFI